MQTIFETGAILSWNKKFRGRKIASGPEAKAEHKYNNLRGYERLFKMSLEPREIFLIKKTDDAGQNFETIESKNKYIYLYMS